MKRRVIGLILFAILLSAPIAQADSGGATINALPVSQELQANVEVQHQCGFLEQSCVWYGEASQYPASVECPSVFDASHGVWVGSVEQTSGSSSASFSFLPDATVVQLCLYVDAEAETLVGQSHAFNTQSRSEVLPQSEAPSAPPLGPWPSRTSVYVTVKGCKVKPHILINGNEKSVSGRSVWVLRSWHEHIGGSMPANYEFVFFRLPLGKYRFSARFLGDSNLFPSPRSGSTTFRVKRC